jgi:CspA family cold shock protein
MNIGTVKWFNNKKGFGFIVPQGSNEDVFVHYSSIKGDGFRTLIKGATVRFEVERGPKGLHAHQVEPASDASYN